MNFMCISAYSRHTRIGATICNIRVISINMAITRGATTTTPNAMLLKISIHSVDTTLTRPVTLIDFTRNLYMSLKVITPFDSAITQTHQRFMIVPQ